VTTEIVEENTQAEPLSESLEAMPDQAEAQEHIIAKVNGESIIELPHDLYIPPDALEVFLDAFQGPLDLLLYLIRKQNVDILDIPIAKITEQYIKYVELMKAIRLELAAEYLVMAAMLAQIKSRLLLPKSPIEDEEDDPRADLIRRLQEYEQIKNASEELDDLPRKGRDFFYAQGTLPPVERKKALPKVELKDIALAFYEVMQRAELNASHHIQKEPLSVRERMTSILERLREAPFVTFQQCFDPQEGRIGVVVSFIAILELVKNSLIEIVQQQPLSPIHVKAL
jgi:segregation and condensation protein A